jgi:hypothetical protein
MNKDLPNESQFDSTIIDLVKLAQVYDTKTDNSGYLIDSEFENRKFLNFLYSNQAPINRVSYIQFKDCNVIKINNLTKLLNLLDE